MTLWWGTAPKTPAQYLESIISPYKTLFAHYDVLKQHLAQTLEQFPNLKPEMRDFSPGAKNLAIRGTVPFTYKGATYHVPLNIWILYSYPNESPIVVVEQNNELAVPRDHKFVDPIRGHVNFKAKDFVWESIFSVTFLIETLQAWFSTEPPLRRQVQPIPSGSIHLSTQVPPTSGRSTSNDTPPLANSKVYISNPVSPPPMNPFPPSQPLSQPLSPPHVASPPIVSPVDAVERAKEQLILDRLPLVLSAYEDRIMKENHKDNALSMELSVATSAKESLTSQLANAKHTVQQLQSLEAQLMEESRKLETLVSEKRAQQSEGNINYDTLAEPQDPTVRAAIACHAKDLAIEDTLYHLQKALQNGVVDLKQFLKATRELASEQYYQRALLRKLNVTIPASDAY